MNYIKLLSGFFEKASNDERLNPTHVSMYMAIFQFWNINHFQNPISISRNQIMRVSKICSNATYHKCMKELHGYGYLEYCPSFNPYKGSLVHLFNLGTDEEENGVGTDIDSPIPDRENGAIIGHKKEKDDTMIQSGESTRNEVIHTENQTGGYQQLDLFCHTKIETGTVQALVPSINVINVINKKGKHKKENVILKTDFSKKTKPVVDNPKEKSCAKKETKNTLPKAPLGVEAGVGVAIPTLDAVLAYFVLKEYAPIEAEKFYNYFQSNGWLVGGKAKMKDWNAAARNWILNAKGYSQPKKTSALIAANLQAIKNKNYNEPL